MLKKTLRLIRNLIIGTIWTYLFMVLANLVLFYLWNFNLFSAHSWKTIGYFWEAGGVIKKAKDYLFLFMLLCVPWFWIWGWRLLTRVNYLNILLFPVNAYNRYIINKYGHDSSRIILKNLKSSQKSIEEIKARLESIKPEAPKEVNTIREEIRKKLENTGTKYN